MTDIRYAIRLLLKAPGFTLIAVLTLALGIGATTAIFGGVNAVLLRPLPFPDSHRLVFVWETFGLTSRSGARVTAPDFLDWQRETAQGEQRVFERLAAYATTTVTLAGDGENARVPARRVSADYFRVLGVAPAIGRDFTAADEPEGAPRSVLLSDDLWRTRFNADRGVLGRTLVLNGEPTAVIGVLPADVGLFERAEQFYLPLALTQAERRSTGDHFLNVIARLGSGVSSDQAQSIMGAIAARIGTVRPHSNKRIGVLVQDMHEALVLDLRQPVLLFMGAVGLLLSIACANVANLQLVRTTARQREVAIRIALGAGRWRVVRQFLLESVALATIGGAVGLVLAVWASGLVSWVIPDVVPRLGPSVIDIRVAAFALAATMITGIVFGLTPAWQLSRKDLRVRLNESARGSAGPERHRITATFVIVEIALALTLLIGAGLLIRSFARLHAVDPGFRTEGVLTLRVSLPEVRYGESARAVQFFSTLLERIRGVPGVIGAGAISALPLRDRPVGLGAPIEGRPTPTGGDFPFYTYRGVMPGYFESLGVPIVKGRDLSFDDREGRPRVGVINRTAAQRFWPTSDPIGARIEPDDGGGLLEIVGVVADTKGGGLAREVGPELFVSTLQAPKAYWRWTERTMTFTVRTSGDPTEAAAPVREIVRAMDASLPVYEVATLNTVVRESIATPRRYVLLVSAFAAAALLLAVLGIYGVMAFIVAERTHEIGVRVALGAARRDIMTLVMRRSARFCAIGVALGVAGALAVSRSLTTLLYGITATDVSTYVMVSTILFAVALLATFVPARRAMRVSPLVALRSE